MRCLDHVGFRIVLVGIRFVTLSALCERVSVIRFIWRKWIDISSYGVDCSFVIIRRWYSCQFIVLI